MWQIAIPGLYLKTWTSEFHYTSHNNAVIKEHTFFFFSFFLRGKTTTVMRCEQRRESGMKVGKGREESDVCIINSNFLQVRINSEWTIHWHHQWLWGNKSKIPVWVLIKRTPKCPKSVGTYVHFFFHGYKIICHDVKPEPKSVCRLQRWHPSSLIQELEAIWCESKQQVTITSQNARLLARDRQVGYICPKQLTNHHHLLSIYGMDNIGDVEPVVQWMPLFMTGPVFTERMCEVRKNCWSIELRGKITAG